MRIILNSQPILRLIVEFGLRLVGALAARFDDRAGV
jgi:hypothetical protein